MCSERWLNPWLSVRNLGIRNSDPEIEDDADAEKTLEFEEAKNFAGSGLDLPGFVLGPRGVLVD